MVSIKVEQIEVKYIAGMNISTSPLKSKAHLIWKAFMPHKNEVSGPEDDVFYSIQEYPSTYSFDNFDPAAEFTTWAAKEIFSSEQLPRMFSHTIIEGGSYAVWTHIGTAASIGKDMMYFHTKWLPTSGYMLDKKRKHFEMLGPDYIGPQNPESKEKVFIPILPKNTLKNKDAHS